jgi:hypothetical protein
MRMKCLNIELIAIFFLMLCLFTCNTAHAAYADANIFVDFDAIKFDAGHYWPPIDSGQSGDYFYWTTGWISSAGKASSKAGDIHGGSDSDSNTLIVTRYFEWDGPVDPNTNANLDSVLNFQIPSEVVITGTALHLPGATASSSATLEVTIIQDNLLVFTKTLSLNDSVGYPDSYGLAIGPYDSFGNIIISGSITTSDTGHPGELKLTFATEASASCPKTKDDVYVPEPGFPQALAVGLLGVGLMVQRKK